MPGKGAHPAYAISTTDVDNSVVTHVQHRELLQNRTKLLFECILRELDFSHVKVANAAYFEVFMNNLPRENRQQISACTIGKTVGAHRRCLPLSPRQHDIQKVRRRGHRCNRL